MANHLGNIRVTVDEQGEVVTADDYYPFGLQMPGRSYNVAFSGNQYKYNSKELDDENGLDWYSYGARYYDPQIARWMVVDPLAEKTPAWTPYRYGFNNPLRYIDPTGMREGDSEDQDEKDEEMRQSRQPEKVVEEHIVKPIKKGVKEVGDKIIDNAKETGEAVADGGKAVLNSPATPIVLDIGAIVTADPYLFYAARAVSTYQAIKTVSDSDASTTQKGFAIIGLIPGPGGEANVAGRATEQLVGDVISLGNISRKISHLKEG